MADTLHNASCLCPVCATYFFEACISSTLRLVYTEHYLMANRNHSDSDTVAGNPTRSGRIPTAKSRVAGAIRGLLPKRVRKSVVASSPSASQESLETAVSDYVFGRL